MARPQITKVETIRKLKKIYEKDGYITVWNLRRDGMYYAVRKFWGGIEKMKKELGFMNGKKKPRYVRLKKYYDDLQTITKIERKIHKNLNKTKIKNTIGYSYYFVKYSPKAQKIKSFLIKRYNKLSKLCTYLTQNNKKEIKIILKKKEIISKMIEVFENIQSNWFIEKKKEKEMLKTINQMQKINPVDKYMGIKISDKISDWELFELELSLM